MKTGKGTRVTAGLMVALSTVSMGPTMTAQAQTALPPVTLNWYIQATTGPDDAQVFAEANKIIKQKIDATVNFHIIDPGDYETKMNEIAASGQNYDIAWTSSWMFNYTQNAMNGAFLPITTSMLKNYAPTIYKSVPQEFMASLDVGGKLYAVPNYGLAGNQQGFMVQKRFAKKFHLDIKKIHTLQDMAPFFATIQKKEPGIVPYGVSGDLFDSQIYGYWELPVGLVKMNDPHHKIVPLESTQAAKQYLNLMHSWYEKGYINHDAGTIQNYTQQQETGKYAVTWLWTIQPGELASQRQYMGNHDVEFIPLTQAYFGGLSSTLEAISDTSKNPERALMLLNLVDSDPQLYNLLNLGLKGKDYTLVAKNVAKLKPNAGYNTDKGWVFGAPLRPGAYVLQGDPPNLFQQIIKYNSTLKISEFSNFVFDESSVKTQMANINNVNSQYQQALFSGTVDPKQGLAQYQQAMEQAGEAKVIQAEQQQLDAYLKKNGQN